MAAQRNRNQKNPYRGQSYVTYGNVAYEFEPDYTPYYTEEEEREEQKAAERMRIAEIREHRMLSVKSVAVIMILFLGCIAFMGMHVVVANENLELRKQRTELADLKATNAILSAEITEQIDMDFIKQEATTRLGMAEPQPYQVVYIDVPKQSYTVQYAADAGEVEESTLAKVSKLLKKD